MFRGSGYTKGVQIIYVWGYTGGKGGRVTTTTTTIRGHGGAVPIFTLQLIILYSTAINTTPSDCILPSIIHFLLSSLMGTLTALT